MDILPGTTYVSPPRQSRARQLNTIIEEPEYANGRSDSEGELSDRTVIGRPAAWNPEQFAAAPRKSSRLTSMTAASPVSPMSTCSASSDEDRNWLRKSSARESVASSDAGTVFSESSCPSMTSDPTIFTNGSSRNSVGSNVSNKSATGGRNRYPALLIPRSSWEMTDSPIKEISLPLSASHKMTLSPAILSNLARHVPAEAATPSLGSSSSIASESPCIPSLSGPGTPDMRNLAGDEDGAGWGAEHQYNTNNPLEIALDEEHSILLSPAEAHGPMSAAQLSAGPLSALLSPREREWGEMVVRFPPVPGATPQLSSAGPSPSAVRQAQPEHAALGLMLPNDALLTLNRLTRQVSPDEKSVHSRREKYRQEMRERSEPNSAGSRPRSMDGVTPYSDTSFAKLSDYSFTQLSIPSPGGFFSSLQAGTRQTWCLNRSRDNSVPTSAVAETFYNNWNGPEEIQETVVTVEDTNLTEGPPTVTQQNFNRGVTHEKLHIDTNVHEDQDLYGAGPEAATTKVIGQFEYEEAYEEEIKQAAEVNLDRTGSWLAQQTSYLSALRENNPVNDLEEPSTPHPLAEEEEEAQCRTTSMDANILKTVRFLEDAKSVTSPVPARLSADSSPQSEGSGDGKEHVFRTAFEHLMEDQKKRDAFLHASSRLEATRSSRIALPQKHIENLMGKHSVNTPKRPKYSGPFNQNPRATGIFERTQASLAFEGAEREQRAIDDIQSSKWQIDALRSIYGGRLLASPAACQRLSKKAKVPLTDPDCIGNKRVRVLDFGGESTASWGWHAAHEWPNVKVYTVITKEQATSQRPSGETKPAGPANHRTVSVPRLWQLPFRNGHFDVVSARSLHALLHHNPVPEVPEIDEWELTLKECMRVLKPGGYIDFLVMDCSIARAGAKGENVSSEFDFELHRRGYDREPARSWLRRLKKGGFVNVKRAWMFWPMGRKPEKEEWEAGALEGELHALPNGKKVYPPAPKPRPVSDVSSISKIVKQYMDVEAVQGPVGTTKDVADITGLLGARMWEEWLLKLRREAGCDESKLLEGIDAVLEEGKERGSGWKVCVGWAQKPRPKKQVQMKESPVRGSIVVALDANQHRMSTMIQMDETVEFGSIPMMIET